MTVSAGPWDSPAVRKRRGIGLDTSKPPPKAQTERTLWVV